MIAIRQRDAGKIGSWRYAMWAALSALLVIPLVAMQFTREVRWDLADFVAGAALLISLGASVELAFHLFRRSRARWMMTGACASILVLIWADAAIGIF